MKLICKNTKNYKITLNSEYDVVEEVDPYVKIINDAGKLVRYDRALFQEVNEIPLPPPPPPVRTETQIIQSLNSTLSGGILTFTYRDRTNQVVTSPNIALSIQNPNISCGIETIDGLTHIMSIIEATVDTEHSDYNALKRAIFRSLINTLKAQRRNASSRGALIFSTNRNDEFEDYYTYLTEMSMTTTDWFVNPNSGNNIKIWTVNTQ